MKYTVQNHFNPLGNKYQPNKTLKIFEHLLIHETSTKKIYKIENVYLEDVFKHAWKILVYNLMICLMLE